jgi:hypothetical protein
MDRCWASYRGGCSDKLTGEHIVSNSLLKIKNVSVKGFPWCKEDFVTVGRGSLTRNILCAAHNSQLSPVDVGGVAAMHDLYRTVELCRTRSVELVKNSEPVHLNANGLMLERWLLKAAINVSFRSQYLIGSMGEERGIPPPYLIDVAYGSPSFSHYMGLYALALDGSYARSNENFSLTPLIKDARIAAFYFSIYSFDFVLSITASPPPASLRAIGITGFPDHILDAQWRYREQKLVFSIDGMPSHDLSFSWT